MKALAVLVLALLPALALGQGYPPIPSDVLRTSSLYTTGAVNLFVDPLGSDSKACTSTGAGACLTFPGALSKLPKNLRHQVTITGASGTFAGAIISGFRATDPAGSSGAGLTLQGTLATATLGAGTATGTATGGTRGGETATPATHGTLVDSGNSWTANALVGYLLELTGGPGSGDLFQIQSNTDTTIVVAGRFSATPTTSTTYAIRDTASIISGPVTRNTDLLLTTSGANWAGFILQNNSFPPGSLKIQKFKYTSVGFYSVYMQDPEHVMVRYSRFDPGGTFAGISYLVGGSANVNGNVWPAITGATYQCVLQSTRNGSSAMGTSELFLTGNVFVGSGGTNGIMATFTSGGAASSLNYVKSLARGIWLGNNAAITTSGDYFDTVSNHCISTSLSMYPGGTTISINGDNFTSCATAVYALGRAFVNFTAVASPGSGNTIGLLLEDGGRIRSDATGYAFTATTDIRVKTLGADTDSTAAAFRLLTPKVIQDANTQTTITEL